LPYPKLVADDDVPPSSYSVLFLLAEVMNLQMTATTMNLLQTMQTEV
jgi:hypothetical protein